MANFVGAIEKFNPYIQQIPTEAYTKVGMFKQQQYEAGIQKVQDNIDRIAGLDIANEGGRQYLKSRVDELTKTLNKYSMVDFSNPDNITQLVSLAKPLYQDENIVNDVVNTGVYRKWYKEANDAFKAGKMELGQFARESSDASVWLNSQVAGSQYTGKSTPNLATKKELVDRIIKAKKDGMEKNEFVYDINYSKDTPYYVKSTNKYYSEADFNNFITESIITDRDREMLMNENWYENQGKSTLQLQQEDLAMYQAKIDSNNRQITRLKNDPLLYAGDKKAEAQQTIDDLMNYNSMLENGKIRYLQGLDLNNPSTRDVFHRDLSEARFVNSLDILRDEVRKNELQKNDQWFKDKELEFELAKEAAKATTARSTSSSGKPKSIDEITDEVALFTPVDPSAPRTELSLNTIQRGWQIRNDEINQSMNNLIGKLQENGVDMNQFIAGWDQVQVGTKAGASMSVPRFRSPEAKENFYNLASGLNYAFTKEAEDGKIDNQSFNKWVKENFANYRDDDPNSKFTMADKIVSDALNTLKGTSALMPRLENLFADKGVVRALSNMDSAIKDKKDMANAYREALLKSNVLNQQEMDKVRTISDDQLLSQQSTIDRNDIASRAGTVGGFQEMGDLGVIQEPDGSFSIGEVFLPVIDGKKVDITEEKSWWQKSGRELFGGARTDIPAPRYDRRYLTGFASKSEAEKALSGAEKTKDRYRFDAINGISNNSLEKANEFVKKTYSYVQENLNSTVQNLKNDKAAYAAVQDGLSVFLTRARLQATPEDIVIDGISDLNSLTGISNVEVRGATISNTDDIFNPNPMYEVTFDASVPDDKGALKKTTLSGKVSLRSFLATNPNYRTSEYAKYFAPALYAQKDAYARIKSTVNPLEGSEASYYNRSDIDPVFNRTNQLGVSEFASDDPATGQGTQFQWESIPIERDGRQTMVSYQVVSLGQNTTLGNLRSRDGQTYAPGAFYIKLKVPTSNGQPKVIFLKKPNGESYVFNNASNAHYTIRDLILNNSEIKMDEIDPKTGEINYFTTDPTTIRGIFNTQLSYNGFSKLEVNKIKDALGKEIQKQEARELQLAR